MIVWDLIFVERIQWQRTLKKMKERSTHLHSIFIKTPIKTMHIYKNTELCNRYTLCITRKEKLTVSANNGSFGVNKVIMVRLIQTWALFLIFLSILHVGKYVHCKVHNNFCVIYAWRNVGHCPLVFISHHQTSYILVQIYYQ